MSPYRRIPWPTWERLFVLRRAGIVDIYATYATGPVGDACLYRAAANDNAGWAA